MLLLMCFFYFSAIFSEVIFSHIAKKIFFIIFCDPSLSLLSVTFSFKEALYCPLGHRSSTPCSRKLRGILVGTWLVCIRGSKIFICSIRNPISSHRSLVIYIYIYILYYYLYCSFGVLFVLY